MAAHIVKPELLAQEIGQRASVNELAAVIQQPGDIRNGRRLRQRPLDLVLRVQGELVDSGGHVLTRQRPLDLVLRVHAASMRCAKSIVQLYLRVKGSASGKNYLDASNAPHFMTIEKDGKRFGSTAVELENGSLLVRPECDRAVVRPRRGPWRDRKSHPCGTRRTAPLADLSKTSLHKALILAAESRSGLRAQRKVVSASAVWQCGCHTRLQPRQVRQILVICNSKAVQRQPRRC